MGDFSALNIDNFINVQSYIYIWSYNAILVSLMVKAEYNGAPTKEAHGRAWQATRMSRPGMGFRISITRTSMRPSSMGVCGILACRSFLFSIFNWIWNFKYYFFTKLVLAFLFLGSYLVFEYSRLIYIALQGRTLPPMLFTFPRLELHTSGQVVKWPKLLLTC